MAKVKRDSEFYRKIGSLSWKNAERSRVVGFAAMPKEKHLAVSSKGGQKTKDDYKTKTPQEVSVHEDVRLASDDSK